MPTTHPTSFSLSDLYCSRSPPPRGQTRSQMGTFFHQSSLKSVRHGGSSAQTASPRGRVSVACENISFRLSLRRAVPAPKRRLYALRLSGASTLLVPDARPKSAARLDRFPPPGWNRPATPAVIARRLGARGVAVPPPPPRRMCVDSFVRILHARLQAMPLNLYSGLPAISSNS